MRLVYVELSAGSSTDRLISGGQNAALTERCDTKAVKISCRNATRYEARRRPLRVDVPKTSDGVVAGLIEGSEAPINRWLPSKCVSESAPDSGTACTVSC